jgi:rod shape-determining protein MreC
MRNLLIFIAKYNAFFLFLIFEISSLIIYVKYNTFQKATFINSTNKVTGNLFAQVSEINGYLSLKEVNDSLARENASLKNKLKSSFYLDTFSKHKIVDTTYKQQYEYVAAKVIANSVNLRNNFITINIGSNTGIEKGMGVICSSGVVGKVLFVGQHYSIVQSLLHKETIVSAMLADSKDHGSFRWSDNLDPHMGLLYDVSNNAQPKLGELVVTSDLSLFPTGIPIGKISNLHAKSGGFFLNLDVKLAVDFNKLQYVEVVINKFAKEQLGLEAQEKQNG